MFYITPTCRIRFYYDIEHENGKRPSGTTYAVREDKRRFLKDENGLDENNWIEVGTGVAICSKDDCFSRKIGRKVSLAKLTQQYDNKTLRKLIWESYFKAYGRY